MDSPYIIFFWDQASSFSKEIEKWRVHEHSGALNFKTISPFSNLFPKVPIAPLILQSIMRLLSTQFSHPLNPFMSHSINKVMSYVFNIHI